MPSRCESESSARPRGEGCATRHPRTPPRPACPLPGRAAASLDGIGPRGEAAGQCRFLEHLVSHHEQAGGIIQRLRELLLRRASGLRNSLVSTMQMSPAPVISRLSTGPCGVGISRQIAVKSPARFRQCRQVDDRGGVAASLIERADAAESTALAPARERRLVQRSMVCRSQRYRQPLKSSTVPGNGKRSSRSSNSARSAPSSSMRRRRSVSQRSSSNASRARDVSIPAWRSRRCSKNRQSHKSRAVPCQPAPASAWASLVSQARRRHRSQRSLYPSRRCANTTDWRHGKGAGTAPSSPHLAKSSQRTTEQLTPPPRHPPAAACGSASRSRAGARARCCRTS